MQNFKKSSELNKFQVFWRNFQPTFFLTIIPFLETTAFHSRHFERIEGISPSSSWTWELLADERTYCLRSVGFRWTITNDKLFYLVNSTNFTFLTKYVVSTWYVCRKINHTATVAKVNNYKRGRYMVGNNCYWGHYRLNSERCSTCVLGQTKMKMEID